MLSKLSQETENNLRSLAAQNKLLRAQTVEISKLKEENKSLKQIVKSFRVNKRELKTGRNYYDLKRTAKHQVKNNIKRCLKSLNEDLSSYGICIPKANIMPLNDDSEKDVQIFETVNNQAEQMDPLECLYYKDKKMFSEEDYKAIRKDLRAPICSLDELIKLKKEINKQFLFHKTNDSKCFFVDIVKSINNQVKKYLSKCEKQNIETTDTIKVKICCDGTKIGRKLYLLNFAFTIINDTENCSSCFSHFTLAIGEIKECYDDLKEPIEYLMSQLKILPTFEFNNKLFKLEYYFAADLKLALIITGLKAANSDFPCLYCHCKKNSLHLIQECELRSNAASIKNMGEKGYKRASLLGDVIPFSRIIICTLHLRLRIFEVLLKQLIKSLANLDQYDGVGYVNENHTNLSNWLTFLNEKCKIKCVSNYQFNRNNAGGITRDFSGGEVLKILSEIDINERFPNLRDKENLQTLWRDFYYIERMISKNSLSYDQCKISVTDWSKLFLKIYTTNHSQTPYIHMFINHLPDLIAKEYSVNDFNQQGLEKLNDITTREYYLATNKQTSGMKFIDQILTRRLRIENYEIMKNE